MNTNEMKVKQDWTINALLAVILLMISAYYVNTFAKPAFAAGGGWETNGVMAMASSGVAERLVLVDTKRLNIMIYRAQNGGLFRLTGARSYKYDIEIEDTAGTPVEKGEGITFHDAKLLYETKKP